VTDRDPIVERLRDDAEGYEREARMLDNEF